MNETVETIPRKARRNALRLTALEGLAPAVLACGPRGRGLPHDLPAGRSRARPRSTRARPTSSTPASRRRLPAQAGRDQVVVRGPDATAPRLQGGALHDLG